MTTPLDRCCAAPPSWQIGRYRFERWPRAATGPGSRGRRWGCSNGCLGVANYRTPLGAWLALRRWAREDAARRAAWHSRP
jgi:hypothetical protein